MTDIEGVAGVVTFEQQSYSTGLYFEEAKHLLNQEVNAAVEGLVSVGVEEVLVIDGHGPGGIKFEEIHPRALLLHGRPLPPEPVRRAVMAEYDVALMIGQHAMAGIIKGNLAHTQSSRHIDHMKLNGTPIGEIAQFALYCGALNIPMIFLSGDDAACHEVEALIPDIVTAAVKRGLSRNSAISLSKEAARSLIHERVQAAMQRHTTNPIAPLIWDPPYELEIRYFHTDTADAKASAPDVERVDSQTVRIRGNNILELIYR